jgi:predicted PhzF superfamily epimerase YddE/YHI9
LYESGLLQPNEMARYHTKSGLLQARCIDGSIELDFPVSDMEACGAPEGLSEALGLESKLWRKRPTRPSYLIEVASEAIVRGLAPDFAELRLLGIRSVMVTARAETGEFDFVSRFFAPGVGVNEDPVTGSAHCTLTPYWSAKLGKTTLHAYQASSRGGSLICTLEGDRVKLAGKALTILRGELLV